LALGCIMMRVWPPETRARLGVATQDPLLRKNFTGDPAHAVNFMKYIAEEVRENHGAAWVPHHQRNDRARGQTRSEDGGGALEGEAGLDFSKITLTRRKSRTNVGRYCQIPQEPRPGKGAGQHETAEACAPALERREKVVVNLQIRNVKPRGRQPSWAAKSPGANGRSGSAGGHGGLAEFLRASAGQSFGAFVPPGVDAHARRRRQTIYLGQGIVRRQKSFCIRPQGSDVRAGGKTFINRQTWRSTGATAGEVYICGMAGEAVRRAQTAASNAVVEAVGDSRLRIHEPAGSVVVIRPRTGREFRGGHVRRRGHMCWIEAGDFCDAGANKQGRSGWNGWMIRRRPRKSATDDPNGTRDYTRKQARGDDFYRRGRSLRPKFCEGSCPKRLTSGC